MSDVFKNPIWRTVDHPEGTKSLVIYFRFLPDLKGVIEIVTELYKIVEKYKKTKNITFDVFDGRLGIHLHTRTFNFEGEDEIRKEFDDNDNKLAEEIKTYMQKYIN